MIKVAAIILENEQGEILLYLRDDKPGLPFPGHWDLFGGHVEDEETPEEALVREVKEELGIELRDYRFFRKYECLTGDVHPNTKFVYTGRITQSAGELTLNEGQRLQFFSKSEIPNLRFANILKDVVMDFLTGKK
jgi:8-oxo-dGTP diphosphatase